MSLDSVRADTAPSIVNQPHPAVSAGEKSLASFGDLFSGVLVYGVVATVFVAGVFAAWPAAAPLGAVAILAVVALVFIGYANPAAALVVYIVTMPFVAGIPRGYITPLLRPNEAILLFLFVGVAVGSCRRRFLVHRSRALRVSGVEISFVWFAIASVVWPLFIVLIRGSLPTADDLAAVLPVIKLVVVLYMARLACATGISLMVLVRSIVWPAAVIAVIAVLQTLEFPLVVDALQKLWSPDAQFDKLSARGSTTLASPIVTGDVVLIGIVVLAYASAMRQLRLIERISLGGVLAAGLLAAGQFSAWIGAAISAVIILADLPEARKSLAKLWPIFAVAVIAGSPAFYTRFSVVADGDVPQSWTGRYTNLTEQFLPQMDFWGWVFGVSPNPVLDATERWRQVIYLESGYLQFIWIGGIPLLLAFLWFAIKLLRQLNGLRRRPSVLGGIAGCLRAIWIPMIVLTIFDPHLTLRGTGDLLMVLFGAVSVGYKNSVTLSFSNKSHRKSVDHAVTQ